MEGFTSLSIHPNNVFFKPKETSAGKQICEVDEKVKNLIKNKDSSDSSIGQLLSSRNQLKRKIDLQPQKCLRKIVKVTPLQGGAFVVDQAKRIGVAAFPVGRSLCLGILTGCVQRVFVQAMLNYYYRPLSSLYIGAQLEVHDYTDLCVALYIMFVAPLIEEFAYRGFVQKYVCNATKSPLAGIVVSAGMFGVDHLSGRHKWVVAQSVTAGLGGIVYGTLNHHLGLAASIGAHMAHNSFFRIVPLLSALSRGIRA